MMSKNDLIKACEYFGLNFRGYLLLATAISLAPSTLASLYFPVQNGFLKVLLFFTITLLCQYLLLTLPYLLFSRHDFIVSLFGYLILSDLKAVTRYSSLYDACLHVYRARYPIVSEMFKDVLVSGMRGEDLREALNRLAVSQPSRTFREGLQALLLEGEVNRKGFLKTYSSAHDVYRELTSKIETKFSILMGLCFFTPILSTVFASMYFREAYSIILLASTTIFLLSIVYIALTRALYVHRVSA